MLESRLDNLVYRSKFVPTVFAARQFVNHGHVLVNGKKVNIPSYLVKAGDVIVFPTGPEGAHCIRNASENEKLIYIDFDTINVPDLVHLLDAKKVMYSGPYSSGVFDEQ